MNLLANTPEFADAWIENRGRRGVLVFAPQALLARITDNWTSVGALSQAEDLLGIRIAAGFGIGASARTSVLLAERAAARAELAHQPCGYLVEDSGIIIGPIGAGPPPDDAAADGTRLDALARNVGLSPSTLSRLVALERTLGGGPISPSDLAGSLGITDPSGRRLIRKLQTRGLVTDGGTEQTHRRGRPCRLYRLAIDAAIDTALVVRAR
jgi:DNA-binding transcriptional ArsR family regulator